MLEYQLPINPVNLCGHQIEERIFFKKGYLYSLFSHFNLVSFIHALFLSLALDYEKVLLQVPALKLFLVINKIVFLVLVMLLKILNSILRKSLYQI